MVRLSRKQAIDFLEIDAKLFENFFRYADEFRPLPRPNNRGRLYFDSDQLERWRQDYESRVFTLAEQEYSRCLDFALAIHFRGYAFIDWGTARQREFGQKISNWVRGQLGELGVGHFCHERLGIDIELDFDMHDTIVPQDVLAIIEDGTCRSPTMRIGIKATKPKNAYLVLSPNEVEREERMSDAYILTRVDLPDDHLLRVAHMQIADLVRDQQHFSLYGQRIGPLGDVSCEVAGFVYRDELEVVDGIPGQRFTGYRYVKKSGGLRRTIDDWVTLFQ